MLVFFEYTLVFFKYMLVFVVQCPPSRKRSPVCICMHDDIISDAAEAVVQ